ncbi:MAG: acyl carrier protein [Armatimonadota bacterium]
MTDEEIKSQLKELIVERLFLNVKPEDIKDDENLMETYNIDSVQLFEIVVGLEEVFEISMGEADFSIELFENVNSIAEYVKSNLAGAQG